MSEVRSRVAITWPSASTPPSVLAAAGVAIEDLDSGEQLLDVTALRIDLGSATNWGHEVIEVTLTRLVDSDGKPVGGGRDSANRLALTDEYSEWLAGHTHNNPEPYPLGPDMVFPGQKFRTAEFRYVVGEMRTAAPITPFDTEARTITEAQAARDGS